MISKIKKCLIRAKTAGRMKHVKSENSFNWTIILSLCNFISAVFLLLSNSVDFVGRPN